jgi:hypothetical protein
MTCSRCSRCLGASASSLTRSEARRCRHAHRHEGRTSRSTRDGWRAARSQTTGEEAGRPSLRSVRAPATREQFHALENLVPSPATREQHAHGLHPPSSVLAAAGVVVRGWRLAERDVGGGGAYLRGNVIARSSFQVESSRDNFQRPSILSPSALIFPLNFCEKPGECRHMLQTPSLRLTW